jgi:hypothetical protein
MAPPDLSTYRPAVILLAGFTATVAVLFLHQHYLKPASPASDGGLHRSNAVRRPHVRRRRHGDEPGSSNSSDSPTISEIAISRLLAREANGVEYGTFAPLATGDALLVDSLPQFRLLPPQLPSVNGLLSLASISETTTREIQYQVHSEFMDSFLAQEYPHGHLIQAEEAQHLRERLTNLNVDSAVVEACIADFNAGRIAGMPTADLVATGLASAIPVMGSHHLGRLAEPLVSADGANDTRHGQDTHAPDTRETVVDDQSYASHHNLSDGGEDDEEVQDVMSLAYRVAEDDSRKMNYVHRGVMCNGCRVQPIQGIRYSCANCPDYDLCEDCEANQIHIKTHIFYKVRIPAPLLGYHRPTAPTWYPGKPHLLTEELREKFPNALKKRLAREYNMESDELHAHWEQFICLASCVWTDDPIRLGVAIDRDGFDKCFCPPTSLRSPPPNLIYDRLFAFYDTDDDGKIGFKEFLDGLASLKDNSRHAKLRRIFKAYDLDQDGIVCRKDFLRVFRAYYSYSKEMAMASIAAFDENLNDPYARDIDRDEVRRKIEGGRPVSAIFEGSIPAGHSSQSGVGSGVGKSLSADANGDLAIIDKNGVLEESDDAGNHNDFISEAALASLDDRPLGSSFRGFRTGAGVDETAHQLTMNGDPHIPALSEDVINAPGRDVPFDGVADPVEPARILYTPSQRPEAERDQNNETIRRRALHDRWRKRKFYTDEEEGATVPPGYIEEDGSDDEADHKNGVASPDSISDSRRRSLQSRSSSKVRFEDDVTDTDYETRSNTSSKSIPVGERWGGHQIRDIEKDVGKEVLYQAILQGFNTLLDPLFKEKEDLAIAADNTRALRQKRAEKSSELIQPERSSTLLGRSEEALQTDSQKKGNGPANGSSETAAPSVPSSSDVCPSMPDNLPDPLPLSNNQRPIHFPRESMAPDVSSAISDPDPTMSQNRPNSPPLLNGTVAHNAPTASPTTSQTTRSATLDTTHPPTTKRNPTNLVWQEFDSPLPPAAEQEPSSETLALWAKHDEVDAEAKKRGGYGKLDLDEFSAKMVREDSADGAAGENKDKDEEGEPKWGTNAGLGRLGFVGTWIEQAAF